MTTIFVAKLDFGVTEEELLSVFGEYGTVAKANIAKDKDTGKPRGFAFVEMPDAAEASAAIDNLDGHVFNGRACVVKQADDRSSSKPAPRQEGGFKPRTDSRPPSRPDFNDRPKFNSEAPPIRPSGDDDDSKSDILPIKSIPKKKLTPTKKTEIDTTNDGKSKKPKMNAYKKSGKDNQFFNDDDDLDEEIDLFGLSEDDDEDLDDVYSKYVVNSDDDDDDFEDEDYDDDEDYEDDED